MSGSPVRHLLERSWRKEAVRRFKKGDEIENRPFLFWLIRA